MNEVNGMNGTNEAKRVKRTKWSGTINISCLKTKSIIPILTSLGLLSIERNEVTEWIE